MIIKLPYDNVMTKGQILFLINPNCMRKKNK